MVEVAAAVAAVVLVVTGVVPAGAAPAPPGATAAAPAARPALALRTPVLSLRRVPELVAVAAGTTKLDTALDATMADPHLGAVAANSCLVVQAGAAVVYARNPTLPVLPASNLKLLTMTAALDRLPAGDRLVTTVKAAAAPRGGTVAGDLYLVGGGDPLLRTPDYVASLHYPEQIFDNLTTLADQVRAAGVTTVAGSVIGDESRYDTQRYVATWPPRYMASGEVGPLSALSVNDGFAAPKAGPAAPQPAAQAAATFTALLRARGITVAGAAGAGTAPAGAVDVTSMSSAPLLDLADEILRRSDNNGAELITKELGRQANPATPTTAAGVAAVQAALGADGLPMAGLHMVDGSGLDRSDRVTCQLIEAALQRSGPAGGIGRGLAVAGQNGTLFHRLSGTPAAGRLLGKTGSLEGVSALSGFVLPTAPPAGAGAGGAAAGGATVTFSLIFNSVASTAAGDALCDRIAVLLAQFPQAPPVAQLAPVAPA